MNACVYTFWQTDTFWQSVSRETTEQKTEERCHLTRINTHARTHTRLHINTHHYCSTHSIKSRQWDMWVHTLAGASMSNNIDLTTHFIVEYTQRRPLSDVNVYVNRGWCKLHTPVCINTLTPSEGGCLVLSYWEKQRTFAPVSSKTCGINSPLEACDLEDEESVEEKRGGREKRESGAQMLRRLMAPLENTVTLYEFNSQMILLYCQHNLCTATVNGLAKKGP